MNLCSLAFVSSLLLAPFPSLYAASPAPAQPAAVQLPDFTYQGRLERDGASLNGSANLVFTLWNAQSGGGQIGSTITENGYPIVNGVFSINLSFPGAFAGEQRWLQVSVDGVALPRQPVATAPVAQYALAAPAGQAVNTVYGTQMLALAAGASYTLIPGLTQTVTVPANAIVHISTDGGAQHTSTGTNYSAVDIGIVVDGLLLPSAGQRRLILSNTPAVGQMIGNWSMSLSRVLSPGVHTIQIHAANPGTFTANVSSGTTQLIQGQLTVMVLKQ